jgi:hypothetical protein
MHQAWNHDEGMDDLFLAHASKWHIGKTVCFQSSRLVLNTSNECQPFKHKNLKLLEYKYALH